MKILESNWDEFNSYPSVNFYYNHFKEEPHVVIFEGYECLYPLIKNKIIVERPKEIHKLSCTDRDAIIKNKILLTHLFWINIIKITCSLFRNTFHI